MSQKELGVQSEAKLVQNKGLLTCHKMGMEGLCVLMLLAGVYKELGAQSAAPSAINMHSLEVLQVIFNSHKLDPVASKTAGNLSEKPKTTQIEIQTCNSPKHLHLVHQGMR